MRIRSWLVVVVALVAARLTCGGDEPAPAALRLATFNIEDFPKSERQVAGAFAELARLHAGIVALQEIVDPARFVREARARLGPHWEFVHVSTAPRAARGHPIHHLGVLFDGRAWALVSTAVHDDTRLPEGRHKPTFEVRLRPTGGGAIVRVLVVHLKAGGEHTETRARQLAALAEVARAAMQSGERVVLLGDFNATHDAIDRGNIRRLAAHAGMAWVSEPLACSAFWSRDDGCPRSRLDHVLAWRAARAVAPAGACASEGCDGQDRCPVYRDAVSDHCPVIVDF